jgi:hypothetical protein
MADSSRTKHPYHALGHRGRRVVSFERFDGKIITHEHISTLQSLLEHLWSHAESGSIA